MSDIFSAIADPTRRQVLDLLAGKSPMPVGELAESLSVSQPTLSKHLKMLREVGLVSVETRAQSRYYSLESEQLRPVAAWVIKHAAAKAGAEVAHKAEDAASRLGGYLAEGVDWVGEKVAEQTKIQNLNQLGRQIGRKLAEARVGATNVASEKLGKEVEDLIEEAKEKFADLAAKARSKTNL